MHTADVKEVLKVYSVEIAARERDDLKEDPIVVKLRKASWTPHCSDDVADIYCLKPRLEVPAMMVSRLLLLIVNTLHLRYLTNCFNFSMPSSSNLIPSHSVIDLASKAFS